METVVDSRCQAWEWGYLNCVHVIPVIQCGKWGHIGDCGHVSPDTVFVEGYHT